MSILDRDAPGLTYVPEYVLLRAKQQKTNRRQTNETQSGRQTDTEKRALSSHLYATAPRRSP